MESHPPYKRTQYLVDRPYQLRFVTRVFMAVLLVAVVSTLISVGLLRLTMYEPDVESKAPLIAASLAIAITLLIELLLAIPIIFVFGIRQSHRIVGPMDRVKRALQAIGNGDFSQRLVLREGDALLDLSNVINKMAEDLSRRYPRSPG